MHNATTPQPACPSTHPYWRERAQRKYAALRHDATGCIVHVTRETEPRSSLVWWRASAPGYGSDYWGMSYDASIVDAPDLLGFTVLSSDPTKPETAS